MINVRSNVNRPKKLNNLRRNNSMNSISPDSYKNRAS